MLQTSPAGVTPNITENTMHELTPKNSIFAAGGKTPAALAWRLVENRLARLKAEIQMARNSGAAVAP